MLSILYDNSFYSTDDNAVNWVNDNGVGGQ